MRTISEVLEKSKKRSREAPNSEVVAWLQTIDLEPEVLDQLLSASFNSFVKINNISFNKLNDIKTENLDPQNIECIESGYLIIGSGLNGDPIIYSLETKTVGYVSHDELWEDEDHDIEEIVSITSYDIPSFFTKAVEDTFPVDFYECYEYLQKGS